MLLFFSLSIQANVIYVDSSANTGGNGTSWVSAYKYLQDAIYNSSSGDSIWVAKGTYYPDEDEGGNVTENARTSTFNIESNIKIFGGFKGTEISLNDRDWETYITILSGDIGTLGNNTDNTYHVVYCFNVGTQTILDGFSIKDGNANGSSPENNGGGILNYAYNSGNSSSPVIRNCFICNNLGGYAVCNHGNNSGISSPKIINCLISGNTGGGIFNYGYNSGHSNSQIINCVVSGNSSSADGAGISCGGIMGYVNMTLTNCVIAGNNAASSGGALYSALFGGGTVTNTIKNCIFWGNSTTGGSVVKSSSTITYSYCDIESSGGSSSWNSTYGTNGGSNIDVNPRFVSIPDYNSAPTTAGNLRLFMRSPCLNTGSNAANSELYDLDGEARIQESIIDMGAYEGAEPVIYFVNPDASGDNDGSSWANAFMALQDALDTAIADDIIWVAEGTYYPDIGDGYTDDARDSSFKIPDGVAVYGGFNGTETSIDERNWQSNTTILSGDIDGFPGDSTGNSNNVVHFDNVSDQTILDGFTITKGNADMASYEYGGGIYNDGSGTGSDPVIKNCIITENTAKYSGGAIYNKGSGSCYASIYNCRITNNYAGNSGGGIYNHADGGVCNPDIQFCTINSNTNNGGYGGGIYNYGIDGECNPTISHCIISGNFGYYGGGISNRDMIESFSSQCNPTITNCLISGNESNDQGGGIYNKAGSGAECNPEIINTTISANISGTGWEGGAIYNGGSSSDCSPVLTNCIVWGNTCHNGQIYKGSTGISYSYSNIQGSGGSDNWDSDFGTDDGNNIDIDPCFKNLLDTSNAPSSQGNFRLCNYSPCIDTADSTGLNFQYDLDSNSRKALKTVDMGPYEYDGPMLNIPDTVDLGNLLSSISQDDSVSFLVTNTSDYIINIDSTGGDDIFHISYTSGTIPVGNSITAWMVMDKEQLPGTYSDTCIIYFNDSLTISTIGKCTLGIGYYTYDTVILEHPWFQATNQNGDTVFTIDHEGNMYVAASEINYGEYNAGSLENSFIIKASSGDTVFAFNLCNAYIQDTIFDNQPIDSLAPAGAQNNLIIRNADGDTVARFNESKGRIYIKGSLCNNTSLNCNCNFICGTCPVTDADGNSYNTVTIGSQCWMAENLRTTIYKDGSSIVYPGTDNTAWINNTTGAYAWYNNDESTYKDPYGALYNWYAVNNSNGLCPDGWHVASKAEWGTMVSTLGGGSTAGAKLKEAGTEHWSSDPNGATNESGFTALPGGDYYSSYYDIRNYGEYWTSTSSDSNYAWYYLIYTNNNVETWDSFSKKTGLTVRCIKDE